MERINGVEKIDSYEQYLDIKQMLENELEEYKWAVTSKDPLADVTAQIGTCTDKLYKDQSKDEQREILQQIQVLKTRYGAIKKETYIPSLRRNITAHLLAVEQYEADMEKRNFFDIVAGLVKSNKETTDYFKRKYMLSLASMTGDVPGYVNMDLDSMDDILNFISKNYDLVGIEIPVNNTDTALVPTFEMQESDISKSVREMTDNFIKAKLPELEMQTTEVKEAEDVEKSKTSNAEAGNKHIHRDDRSNIEKDSNGKEIE